MTREILRVESLPGQIERLGLKGIINFMGAGKAIEIVSVDPFEPLSGPLTAKHAHYLIEGIAIGLRLAERE